MSQYLMVGNVIRTHDGVYVGELIAYDVILMNQALVAANKADALIAENERLGKRLALVDLVHGRKAEERWTNLNALCGERLAALQRVRNRLQLAGATLPAPDPMGTPESGLVQGLCIALALVEEELPKPVVSTTYTRLREKLSKGGKDDG